MSTLTIEQKLAAAEAEEKQLSAEITATTASDATLKSLIAARREAQQTRRQDPAKFDAATAAVDKRRDEITAPARGRRAKINKRIEVLKAMKVMQDMPNRELTAIDADMAKVRAEIAPLREKLHLLSVERDRALIIASQEELSPQKAAAMELFMDGVPSAEKFGQADTTN